MNKKSKIKSTLDSLFTGGRTKPEEGSIESPMKIEKPEPASIGKVESPVAPLPVKEVKQPTAKPVEKAKPKETVKPVEVAKPKETIKAVEADKTIEPVKQKETSQPVEPVSMKTQNTESPKPKESVASVAPAVSIASEVKPVEMKPESAASEFASNRTIDLDDDEHLVIFSLGKELYGVTIHSVESIIKIQAITEVPKTASYVLGVTNLRGTVVPVLDLRKRFNLQFTENTANTRIIIINAEGSKVGIVVDEVTEVLKVAQDSIQPPPPMSTTVESAFINGIAKINDRLVILLDLEKVLASSSRQYNR